MKECDYCGRKVSSYQVLGKPRPPYYDTLIICDECYRKGERSNGRSESGSRRKTQVNSQH